MSSIYSAAHRRQTSTGSVHRRPNSSAPASCGCCGSCRRTSHGPRSRDRSTSPSTRSTPISAASTPSSARVTAVRPCVEHASCGSSPRAAPHRRRGQIPSDGGQSPDSGGDRSPGHPQDHRVATEPGCQYTIRIRGRLGATALSGVPDHGVRGEGRETVLTGSLEAGPRCTGSWRNSKRSASRFSNFAKSGHQPSMSPTEQGASHARRDRLEHEAIKVSAPTKAT